MVLITLFEQIAKPNGVGRGGYRLYIGSDTLMSIRGCARLATESRSEVARATSVHCCTRGVLAGAVLAGVRVILSATIHNTRVFAFFLGDVLVIGWSRNRGLTERSSE